MANGLRNRFRYLWVWEGINALIVFPGFIWLMSASVRVGWFTLIGLSQLSALLLAGAAFAYLKWRDLGAGEKRLAAYKPAFRGVRVVAPICLATTILLPILHPSILVGDSVWLGVAMWVLSMLEYVNYFHYQLMYDTPTDSRYLLTHRRLKRALIAREFRW